MLRFLKQYIKLHSVQLQRCKIGHLHGSMIRNKYPKIQWMTKIFYYSSTSQFSKFSLVNKYFYDSGSN